MIEDFHEKMEAARKYGNSAGQANGKKDQLGVNCGNS